MLIRWKNLTSDGIVISAVAILIVYLIGKTESVLALKETLILIIVGACTLILASTVMSVVSVLQH